MKLKHFLLCAMGILIPTTGFSTEYYVVPGLRATGNDGSSWEKAITMYDIFENDAAAAKDDEKSKYKTGDVFFLAGGTYYNATTPGADAGRIYRGYIFVGGCDQSKGAVAEWPTYPSATPTIFSGDLDENGVPSAGDLRNLIHVRQAKSSSSEDLANICKLIGIDFTCSYSPEGSTNASGAVYCTQGAIELQYCNVYNNVSKGEGSGDGIGAGIHVYGGLYHIKDCNVYNNKANKTGAGFRCTSRGAKKANGVIERCYFGNNEVESRYGGAIAHSSGENMWIVNSTIVDNKAFYEGAGVCANGSTFDDDVRAVHIINCTIAGNTCSADPSELYAQDTETGTVTNPGSWLGSQVRIACDPAVDICNSIIVGRDDDGTIAKAALVLTGKEKAPTSAYLKSYGGSVMGTFGSVMESPTIAIDWKNDHMDAKSPNTYSKIFGTNTAGENGGFTKTLKPVDNGILDQIGAYSLYGFELGEYIETLKKEGKYLPFEIDVTVDQTGSKRSQEEVNGETAPGAYDFLADHGTGIANTTSSTPSLKLQTSGDGIYQVVGLTGQATIYLYNLQGIRIQSITRSNTIDLRDLAKGIYMVNVNGQTFKVAR